MRKLKDKWRRIPLAVKVSSTYALCSILQRCISFVTLPLFTRLLTTEQYGQATIFSSWQGILSIFLTLNLAYGSFSKAMVKYEEDRDGYIASIEGICLCLTAFFLLLYWPFRSLWNQLFELPTTFICIMTVEILSTTAIQLWSGKKRFEFRYISVVLVTLFISLISPIAAYFLVINAEEKGFARILGHAIVTISVGGSFFLYNAYRGKKLFNKVYWNYALRFNIPLLAYYLSQIIFNQSDRIMISHMVGTDKAAIYSVAYSLAMVLTFVLNAINNSYVPWYYGKIKTKKMEENRTVSLRIAILMSALLLGMIWFAPEIIRILAGEKYMEAVYVVPPVAVSLLLLFYSQLFINVEFYYEEKYSLVWASIGAAVINLLLNWIFIRYFGFIAAAYTTLASYIIFAFSNYMVMKKILKKQKISDNAFHYTGLVAIFFLFCLLALMGSILYEYMIVRIIIMIVAVMLSLEKRNYFIGLYRVMKGK